MNNNLIVLIKGELQRLNKYNVFSISIFVAFLWGLILYFIDNEALSNVLPLILLIDSSLMSVMYIGAVSYFEKTESTISTLLVTPVTNQELVLSKVIANTIHNIISSTLIIIAFLFLRDIDINLFIVFLGIISSTLFFTIAGLVISYYQKDFTQLLVTIMILSFALVIPSALYMFGVLTWDGWEYILLLNPVEAAKEIISGGIGSYTFGYRYFVSLVYMIIGAIVLYVALAIPKFQTYAVKQSGV